MKDAMNKLNANEVESATVYSNLIRYSVDTNNIGLNREYMKKLRAYLISLSEVGRITVDDTAKLYKWFAYERVIG